MKIIPDDPEDNDFAIWSDPDTGESYALHPYQQNYLQKIEGVCASCGLPFISKWSINPPNTKTFLGSRCFSYWESLIPGASIQNCEHKKTNHLPESLEQNKKD